MKFKTRYFVKRVFALMVALAVLWQDASLVSMAQSITQESEESSEILLTEFEGEGESAPAAEPGKEEETPEGEMTPEPTEIPGESPVETPEESPVETPEENPVEMPLETPMETPLASPGEEELPLATPLLDVPEVVAASVEGFERYTFRVNDQEGMDYDGSFPITAEDTIFIYDHEKGRVLEKSDARKITWTATAENGEMDAYNCGDDGTLVLAHQFFPFEFRLDAKIELSNESYEMWIGNIRPDTMEKGKAVLDGLRLPGLALCLKNAEGEVEPYNCFFFQADDDTGANARYIEGGNLFYDIREEDNGKYIFAKYGVWNEETGRMEGYQSAVAGPCGYVQGSAAGAGNAVLFQQHINKLTEISKETGQVMNLYIPEGIYIEASEPVSVSDRIRLEAWGAYFTGGFVTKADMGGVVVIDGLSITKAGGTAIDASRAPVCLNDCRISLNNANLLQVSESTYRETEFNNCDVDFTSGGSILKLAGDISSMEREFALGSSDLGIRIVGETPVTMLEEAADIRWNVEGLRPESVETLKLLWAGPGDGNVINNAFYIAGRNGMIANSKVLTMKSVSSKWICSFLADGSTFADDGAKIIISSGNPGNAYEVMSIPEDADVFRPYAVTGQYGPGEGSYSKLLPAGYLAYIVADVNQKGGFPYGALLGRKVTLKSTDGNFVVMQYHADKSVETIASVTDYEATIKRDSVLAELTADGDGEYRITFNTKVKDEPVAEPMVLAVYTELPAAKVNLTVYEEKETEEGTEKILSDGKILTDGRKIVYLDLNGGIARNYYSGDVFTLNQSQCIIPEGEDITVTITGGGTGAELEIPEGAYGTLTIAAHYKSSQGAPEAGIAPYTLQLTSIENVKGTAVDSVYAGRKYYGTAIFDIRSGEAKPYLGVKAGNGDDSRYNLKVTSSSLAGSRVTVQYALDLRDELAWESMCTSPPQLLVETTAGTWGIGLETAGAQIGVDDREKGLRYLFDVEDNSAVYTGALIIDGEKFYQGETQIAVPASVTIDGKIYSVTAMAEGCLNNLYERGIRADAPEIVRIPASITDIRGALITHKNYSNLRQIVVADDNPVYRTYGKAADFDGERDDAQYGALYGKNGSYTELVEIASEYYGDLAWPRNAKWTEGAYDLDFSKITGFWCEEDGIYESWDGMLVEAGDDGAVVIKAPGRMNETVLILPEGITDMKARALEDAAITTLVLPSTMAEWEEGASTQAKNIYVYNQDTNLNPVSGFDSSLRGITFYGFVDAGGNSALKTWVTASKSQGHKFVAMKESSASSDYTIRILRESVTSDDGIEYYEVRMGEELTETFDFDIASKMVNGYPGKTDLTVEWEQEDDKFGLAGEEFAEEYREDGRKVFRAVNPGVTKVVIRKEDETVRTAYFAVHPDYFELQGADYREISFGETCEITAKAYVWNSETEDDEECPLSANVLKEYEQLGAIRTVLPKEREAEAGYDAWKVEFCPARGLAYQVTPLLYQKNGISVTGDKGAEFTLELFGEKRSLWIEPGAPESGTLIPEDNQWNPLLEKGSTIEIPVLLQTWQGNEEALDFGMTLNTLEIQADGSSAYDGEATYQQVFCEVISGSNFADAVIIDKEGKAYLKITARAEGKAQIRVAMPYSRGQCEDMILTVSVGKDMVGSFALTLWEDEVLDSSIDGEDERYLYYFDINEEDENGNLIWKEEIPVSDINDTTGEEPYSALPSEKLVWTVSDTALAELVKGDLSDRNKVTGIRLKGEGTVLVSASVKDNNKATVRMLFTVKDGKPRLHNDSATLDIFKKQSMAEYVLALPDDVRVTGAGLQSAILNKADISDDLATELSGDGCSVCIRVKDEAELSTGKCTLTLCIPAVYVIGEGDESTETDAVTYTYPVALQLTGQAPKASVSAADALDLSIPSKRESALTIKLGDLVNSENTTVVLDESDALTENFADYFTLKRGAENSYTVTFTDDCEKTPAEIVKLFNGKKIKLRITSQDYRSYTETAEAAFKITATAPALKAGGKVTVDTADVTSYDGRNYISGMSYTLTEGFVLLNSNGDGGDGPIEMAIADKQKAYEEEFAFWKEGEKIVVSAAPGLPKGTYTFTWKPAVSSMEEDTVLTEGQLLKEQKISVTIAKSSAKISLSSSRLDLDRNYIYTPAYANLQFDESQIRMFYGSDYWMEGYDYEKINDSITLLKAPKGVTADNSLVTVEMYDNCICAMAEKEAAAGAYQYSLTPYVVIKTPAEEGAEQEIIMALAPLTFNVQVTDTLPAASLTQSTITLDNNDMSARVFAGWNIKGNYRWVDSDKGSVSCSQANAPSVFLEGNEIRVQANESTLKGTYQFEITPVVVLDTWWSEDDNEETPNPVSLKPVKLTVKVNSTRPALKLEKSSLTAYSYYPGGEEAEDYYAPAEAGTEISTGNGYGIGSIEVAAADARTEALQENSDTAITFFEGFWPDSDHIHRLDAIPATGTPKGTYNYLVYARLDGGEEGEGAALEPVKLKVTVNDQKPKFQLSKSSILLPAGRQGCVNITLQGSREMLSGITAKTEYLINEDGLWKLTEEESEGAYAKLETAKDGTVTITSMETAEEVTAAVSYSQEVFLKGNDTPYEAGYTLNISFKSGNPTAVLSAKTITVNRNYDAGAQEGNQVTLSLSNGEEIVKYRIEDINTGNKKGAIGLSEEGRNEYEIAFRAFFKKQAKALEKGKYSFRIIPVIEKDGMREELTAVTVTVDVTDALPTVSASQTKAVINKLDTRGNTYQTICFTPNMPYADVGYSVAVTKGPKGADLSEINFFPEGWDLHNEAWLTIGSTDTEIPDGAYTVTVTPYTWAADGSRVNLKSINIAITVNSPKITASLRTPKMTVDVTAIDSVEMRNSILLTGTNAELVEKFYWKGWELTKKPKDAGDDEIWIEELYADEEHDGKEFFLCWGDRNHDFENGPRGMDVTPGTYEFTLTPGGIESCDGVELNTPGPMKLTVTVKKTVPTIKYSKTSSKLNAVFTSEDTVYYTLSDTSWYLTDVDAVMTSWPGGAGEEAHTLRIDYEGDRLKVRGSDKVPEGAYTFLLEARAERNGMEVTLKEQKYTVTVKNEIPAVKAASSKLTCNLLYTGSYWFEENPEDNFNKKQQTKLTLSKNYGPSHFEDCKIAFTGKETLKAEASKIEWQFYEEDGIIATNLPGGRVAAVGSYPFEITPVIRSDETGAQLTLKPVKLTVTVENKALKASAKAGGKIDLLNREESGIIYQVTLSDKDVDAVREIYLAGPEKGSDESWKFELTQDNPANPVECTIRARDGEELSTKVNYEMRLEVHTEYGKVYYVPVKIKPVQSKLSLTTDAKAVTCFKQTSEETAAEIRITASINNTEAGKMQILADEETLMGNKDFRAVVLSGENDRDLRVKIVFATESAKAKYKAGSKITLPVYVKVHNQAYDTYSTTKVSIQAVIKN